MVSVEFSEGISEILDILKHMEKAYTDKIPKKFKEFLEKNKSKTYVPHLDHSQKINEMNLKEKTKDILAVIYMNYWCTPEEKVEYVKILKENEKEYQAQLKEKYNVDNIFKQHNQRNKIESNISEEISIIQYKESILKKFINRIKNFFNINKKR